MPLRRTAALVATLALLAGSCSDDDQDQATAPGADSTTSTTESATTTTDATTTTTSTPPITALPADAPTCTSPGSFTIAHPPDWEATAECSQFGPAPLTEPEPGTDERVAPVSARIDPVPFGRAASPDEGEVGRAITTVDGRQAVRIETTAGGPGLLPEGTRIVRWVVDLAIGTDDGPGVLVVDAVDLDLGIPFDRATTVLDLMARSLAVDAGDIPENDRVIARFEGGGAPLAVDVAPAATRPSTCFGVVDSEALPGCVEGVDDRAGISLRALDTARGPITAGIVGQDVWSVELTAGEDSMTFLPVPYPGRDSRAFALPLDPSTVTSITLRSLDGSVLAEPEPAEARHPVG